MAYLTGYSEHFVDEKGRVILPKKLKELMGSDLVLTRGLDECVYVLTREDWNAFEAKIAGLPMSKGRDISHFFNTYKTDVTVDKQGRVQVPQALRRIADIQGNAVIVGNGNRAEIWDPERFAKMEQELDTEAIVATMDDLDF